MSTSALRAVLQPGELHRLAVTATSAAASPTQRAGAAALLEVLATEAVPSSPPATPVSAPAGSAITSLSQLLDADTVAALARLEASQRAAAEAAEADVEAAWFSWERNAGMARPRGHDAPAGSALAAAAEDLAWLRPDPVDLTDVRYGWGDGSTAVAPTSIQH